METTSSRLKSRLAKHAPKLVLLLAVGAMLLAAFFLLQWRQAYQLNRQYADGSLIKHKAATADEAYAVGYLMAAQSKQREAARFFTLAEGGENPELRARAKYALGNLYAGIALKVADIQTGRGHLHGVAQIELAREAYKGALRINPELRDARYNLELLDRLSPPKRLEGWERETDGVTLAPQKRDGWASMKDNTRRGLP
jgi:mxaK protein